MLNVLANLAGFSILLLTPYYLVNVLKLTALGSGIVLAMAFAGSLTGRAALGLPGAPHRPAADRLCRRRLRRPRPAAARLHRHRRRRCSWWRCCWSLEGVGQGLLTVAYTDIVTATLPPRDRGVAGSLSLLTRTLGIVAGASVLTALQAHGAEGFWSMAGFLAGYRFAFVAAGGGLLACALSLLSLACGPPAPGLRRASSPVPAVARKSLRRHGRGSGGVQSIEGHASDVARSADDRRRTGLRAHDLMWPVMMSPNIAVSTGD